MHQAAARFSHRARECRLGAFLPRPRRAIRHSRGGSCQDRNSPQSAACRGGGRGGRGHGGRECNSRPPAPWKEMWGACGQRNHGVPVFTHGVLRGADVERGADQSGCRRESKHGSGGSVIVTRVVSCRGCDMRGIRRAPGWGGGGAGGQGGGSAIPAPRPPRQRNRAPIAWALIHARQAVGCPWARQGWTRGDRPWDQARPLRDSARSFAGVGSRSTPWQPPRRSTGRPSASGAGSSAGRRAGRRPASR